MCQHPQHRLFDPANTLPEALSSGTDLSMAKRELQVLRDAQEAASQRVQAPDSATIWEEQGVVNEQWIILPV